MLISVIMAVYNGERFLKETIESVLGQTLRDVEFLIMDDGSSDRSAEILADYQSRDARVVVVSQDNCGIATSLSRAVLLAKGDLIAHIDQDDRALPSWLDEQYEFLTQHRECTVVSSHAHLIDSSGRRIGKSQNSVDVDRGRAELNPSLFLNIVHSSVLMRRKDLIAVGCYRRGFPGVEDRDLWGRIVTANMMIRCNPTPLVEYRLHGASFTEKVNKRTRSTCRGIDMNIVRRMQGKEELSSAEIEEWYRLRPLWNKVMESRRLVAAHSYSSATRHYADRRWLSFLKTLGLAVAIRPVHVLMQVGRKLATQR